MELRPLHPETMVVHSGGVEDPDGAVAAPIVLSSTFERTAEGELPGRFVYSRLGNPNREALERALSELEGGAACAAFASGSAAAMAVLQSLNPGEHAILPKDIYYGTLRLGEDVVARFGIEITREDVCDTTRLQAAIRPNTRLVWVETPSNPMLRITDIAAVCELAKGSGIMVAVDNTFATPLLQRPLGLGANLVVHATSKYLAGHSDVIGGAVVAREANHPVFERIRTMQKLGGAVPSPFDCWLSLRGIRTLAVRLRAQCESASKVAQWLTQHAAVHTVHYPGLASHPGYEIATRQMKRPGAMLSFQVDGGKQEALRVCGATKLFRWATSLGGVESLIEHRASVEQGLGTPDDLVRVSIGLEHADDLIADLEQALG
jgi:cystathionine gamma-synthase